jgi:hypothetical protein
MVAGLQQQIGGRNVTSFHNKTRLFEHIVCVGFDPLVSGEANDRQPARFQNPKMSNRSNPTMRNATCPPFLSGIAKWSATAGKGMTVGVAATTSRRG